MPRDRSRADRKRRRGDRRGRLRDRRAATCASREDIDDAAVDRARLFPERRHGGIPGGDDPLAAAVSALAVFGAAGAEAAERCRGPGHLPAELCDALHRWIVALQGAIVALDAREAEFGMPRNFACKPPSRSRNSPIRMSRRPTRTCAPACIAGSAPRPVDLCAARRRTRFTARPHLPDQGHAGERPARPPTSSSTSTGVSLAWPA